MHACGRRDEGTSSRRRGEIRDLTLPGDGLARRVHEFRIKLGAGSGRPVGAASAIAKIVQNAISAVVTFLPEAFDAQGNYSNSSEQIFRALAAYLAPNDAPPSSRLVGGGAFTDGPAAQARILEGRGR